MKIHADITQGSDAWHEIRLGRIGSTSAHAMLVNGKTENGIGVGMYSLIYEKISEIVTGPAETTWSNAATERGVELESEARRAYELETFSDVTQIGYVSEGDFFGDSPDGWVGKTGCIEIKCPLGPEYVRYAHTQEMDPKHFAQCQWHMFLGGRGWCDYVVYHPDFFRDMFIARIYPDDKAFSEFERKMKAIDAQMRGILEKLGVTKWQL